MTLQNIYAAFRELETSEQKVEFLRYLKGLDLPYDIRYDNLIAYWSTH